MSGAVRLDDGGFVRMSCIDAVKIVDGVDSVDCVEIHFRGVAAHVQCSCPLAARLLADSIASAVMGEGTT